MTEQTNESPRALETAPPEGGDQPRPSPARRRRRGGRGRSRRPAGTPGGSSQPERAEGADSGEAPAKTAEARPARPRGQTDRRQRGRDKGGSDGENPPSKESEADSEEAPDKETPTQARRRRRRRGGRGRTGGSAPGSSAKSSTRPSEAEVEVEPVSDEEGRKDAPLLGATVADQPVLGGVTVEESGAPAEEEGARTRARRRRGGASRRGGSTSTATRRLAASTEDADKEPDEGPEAETAAPPRTRRRRPAQQAERSAPAPQVQQDSGPTRTRRARLPGRRRRREPVVQLKGAEDKTMLITELDERDQIAVLQDRTLVEHYITRSGARSMVGNINLGKVQNVLPGMEAAFIDIGRGRNAVLYAGEVSYDEEIEGEAPRIEHALKAGQNVLVQVTKDPIGGKGARLTQEISLPGRFVVFVPNSQTFGISRRLPDPERQRLKDILKQIRPAGHGLIVRTAAVGASEEDLTADLDRLIEEWARIEKSAKRGRAPRVLYEEPELTIRVVRDLFTGGEFKEIVTDSPRIQGLIQEYLSQVAPELQSKVRMHEGTLPLLEDYHALEQIHKALDRKVWLPSGGYLVIDRTEAMTVVDVNTGKHVGKANLEETVTKTNLEAAEEIARQLRLRDIGGIIIIDFIDMLFEKNRSNVVETLKSSLAQDKTRSQVFDIGPLGLLEVTRKRVSAGLLESFSETCPTCEGRGLLLTHKL